MNTFKLIALYSSTLVIKLLKVVLSQNYNTLTLLASLLLNISHWQGMPTFVTEALCLVSS